MSPWHSPFHLPLMASWSSRTVPSPSCWSRLLAVTSSCDAGLLVLPQSPCTPLVGCWRSDQHPCTLLEPWVLHPFTLTSKQFYRSVWPTCTISTFFTLRFPLWSTWMDTSLASDVVPLLWSCPWYQSDSEAGVNRECSTERNRLQRFPNCTLRK